MPWFVPMASIEPVALDPMARWSLENTTITDITDRITAESTALLAYIGLVALVLMGRQLSADPIKRSLNLRERGILPHRRDGEIRSCQP